jgi:hypothetical protein
MLGNFTTDSELFILDKNGDISLTVARNLKITNQYPDTTGKHPLGTMLMDITGDDGTKPVVIGRIPAGRASHEYNNVFVTDSRDLLQSELQAMLSKAENIIENVPYYEKVASRCKELIPVVNPQVAKQQESDDRISRLEEQFRNQGSDISEIKVMLASLVSQQKSSKKE